MPKKLKRARNSKRASRKPHRKHAQLLLFAVLLLILLVPLLVFLGIQHQRSQGVLQATTKPNVIVIMTDDQRYERDDPYMTMPIVKQRLVAHGVTFNNAYIPTSVCCPSRSSFLSGLYSHNTGVWDNTKKNGSVTHFRDNESQTIAVWMQRAGYKTALLGKYLNGYDATPNRVPVGWDLWYAFVDPKYYDYRINENGHVKKFGHGENAYSTDVLTKRAVEFIQSTPDPFFMVFTPKAPHGNGGDGADNEDGAGDGLAPPIVAKKYQGTCDTLGYTPLPSFNEADRSDKPKWVQKLNKVSLSAVNKFKKAQLCSLKSVDDAVGQILDALGSRLDNTVVIFYSDNGFSYGEHAYTKKNCFYEECAHVPMIISYPKLTPNATTSTALVQNIDLAPTIAELAGITIPVKVNGKSLVPLLTDPSTTVRHSALLEILNAEHNFRGSGILTGQYKYIELQDGEKELYDEISDPYELDNLANAKVAASKGQDYSSIMQDLSAKLAILKQDGDPDVMPTGNISPTLTPVMTTGSETTIQSQSASTPTTTTVSPTTVTPTITSFVESIIQKLLPSKKKNKTSR